MNSHEVTNNEQTTVTATATLRIIPKFIIYFRPTKGPGLPAGPFWQLLYKYFTQRLRTQRLLQRSRELLLYSCRLRRNQHPL